MKTILIFLTLCGLLIPLQKLFAQAQETFGYQTRICL